MFRKSFIISTRVVSKRCMHICRSNSMHPTHITLTKCRILSSSISIKRDFSSLDYIKKIFSVKAESISTAQPEVSTSSKTLEELASEDRVEYIPPPPATPDAIIEVAPEVQLTALGEPTFASLDLITSSPVGLFLKALEYVHVTTQIPWWGTIAIVTIVIRICVFPLALNGIRTSIHFRNHAPMLQEFQMKVREAKLSGDKYADHQASLDLQTYMTDNKLSYMKTFIPPMLQAPIFITMFLSLRRCAELPLESFMTGGMLWFPDLTMQDPYYILPAMCAATTFVTVKFGMEAGMPTQGGVYKVFLYGLPLLIFPFTARFPAALLCYWVTTNGITFLQSRLLKTKTFQDVFAIPKTINHPPSVLKKQSLKTSVQDMQKQWKDQRVARELSNRMKNDAQNFIKAGAGPIPKTYAYNPLVGPPPLKEGKKKKVYS